MTTLAIVCAAITTTAAIVCGIFYVLNRNLKKK